MGYRLSVVQRKLDSQTNSKTWLVRVITQNCNYKLDLSFARAAASDPVVNDKYASTLEEN